MASSSLATELEQAAQRLSPEFEYSGESVYLASLLTRAAALVRAAEKVKADMQAHAHNAHSLPMPSVVLASQVVRWIDALEGKGE